jgi:hypothetical protein
MDTAMPPTLSVVVETGTKRAFASATDWPGWSRAGRDADGALEALVAYGPRYARVVRGSRPAFRPPKEVRGLEVVERLPGDATTDFGAPAAIAEADRRAFTARELARWRTLLRACWDSLDEAAEAARGVRLSTGPRGGGRSRASILEHVNGAESGYARRLGTVTSIPRSGTEAIREAILEGIDRAATEGQPAAGPRGGTIYPVRYVIRRTAWHALDHAWEIEDRSSGG